MSSLLSLSQQPWKRVASVAEGASVFLDDAAAEIFHWSEGEGSDNGGLLKLSLGIYSLYTDLNPIAKDIIAQVTLAIKKNKIIRTPSLSFKKQKTTPIN